MPVTSNRTLFFPDPCSYDTSPPGCHYHPSEQNFSREARRETAMAKDILGEAGLHFDELNKLRVLDPEVTQQTIELKEECKDFVDKIGQFQKIVGGLIELVDQLAKEAENEKMKAIGARNLLKSIAKQREAQQQQLQALIAEKKMQLERLRSPDLPRTLSSLFLEEASLQTAVQCSCHTLPTLFPRKGLLFQD
uniref:Intraflagellar transport 20 n=1 Tax=Equus caballus TaxID=9796 RepID=A0A5F5Q0R7_HORSE